MKRKLVDNPFITEMKDKNGDSWYHQIVIDTIKENKDKEIERLNKLVKGLREERDYLFNKTTTESNFEIERLNNIIDELEKDIKKLYTYGIKNNAEQRDYLLNRLDELKELKEVNKY